MGTLYIVATPIGNREDITLRALRVLREVAIVAAEDTRHTGQLLAHYGIPAHYLSLHGHNERDRAAAIIDRLASGEDVALVSDAGTPLIADPGAFLVEAVAAAGHRVVPIPGPSALLAAVVASGVVNGPFTFVGFLPPKQQARCAALLAVRDLSHPTVYFEGPHRITAMLADALAALGDRPCAICRELTKLHEEIVRTSLAQVVRDGLHETRGEFVVIVDGAPSAIPLSDEETITTLIASLLGAGYAPSAAAKEAANQTGAERAECYRIAVTLKRRPGKV